MNRMSTLLALGCVTVFIAALSACGGGGGGGGGFVPVSYTGNTSPTTLDDLTSTYYTDLAQIGSSFARITPIPAQTPSKSVLTDTVIQAGLSSFYYLSKNISDYLESGKAESPQLTALVSDQLPYDCSVSGTALANRSWDVDTGSLSATISYSNCDEGLGAVINGSITVEANGDIFDSFGMPDLENSPYFTLDLKFLNLQITIQDPIIGNVVTTTYAEVHAVKDALPVHPDYTLNPLDMPIMVMTMQIQGLPYAIQFLDYSEEYTEYYRNTPDPADDYDLLSIASALKPVRIYDSVDGLAYIYTSQPIAIDPSTFLAYSGIINLEGVNTASIDFSLPCPNGTYSTPAGPVSFCY